LATAKEHQQVNRVDPHDRLKDRAAIAGKEDKNKKTKSKSNEPSGAEPSS
jgi:hypothetical protein